MYSIAIDGPAGAGKSTVSKRVAHKLNFIYVDTGALYRTIAFYFSNEHIDENNIKEVIENLKNIKIDLYIKDGCQEIKLFKKDVSECIRTPEISQLASKLSAINEVRSFLLDFQRNVSMENNVVMDGRDIGTVVLPNASKKIFLTASCEERAKRRFKEMSEKGVDIEYKVVLDQIKQRDQNDMNRQIAPLKVAGGAVVIDTNNMNIEEVTNTIIEMVKEDVG